MGRGARKVVEGRGRMGRRSREVPGRSPSDPALDSERRARAQVQVQVRLTSRLLLEAVLKKA